MSPRGKHALFFAVTAALALAAVELLSLGGLYLLEWVRPGRVWDLYIERIFEERSTPERIAGFNHDPEIGWLNRPHADRTSTNVAGEPWRFTTDARGARAGEGNVEPMAVTTYGDSFTLSVEVDDDQTFQTYLARELGVGVHNFGVTAFGTFQALLLLERHLEQGLVAPVTVLGFWEGDLLRVVNRYRPLLTPKEQGWRLFKPSLRAPDGEVSFYANPWHTQAVPPAELLRLAHAATEGDYWAGRWARLSFPYGWQVLRLLKPKHGKRRELWSGDEGRVVLDYLVDRFVSSVRDAGSRPVLLLIPDATHWEEGTTPPYVDWKEDWTRRHPELIVVDVFEQKLDPERMHVRPYRGHHSAYGNRVVARALGERVAEVVEELVPRGGVEPPTQGFSVPRSTD